MRMVTRSIRIREMANLGALRPKPVVVVIYLRLELAVEANGANCSDVSLSTPRTS